MKTIKCCICGKKVEVDDNTIGIVCNSCDEKRQQRFCLLLDEMYNPIIVINVDKQNLNIEQFGPGQPVVVPQLPQPTV